MMENTSQALHVEFAEYVTDGISFWTGNPETHQQKMDCPAKLFQIIEIGGFPG